MNFIIIMSLFMISFIVGSITGGLFSYDNDFEFEEHISSVGGDQTLGTSSTDFKSIKNNLNDTLKQIQINQIKKSVGRIPASTPVSSTEEMVKQLPVPAKYEKLKEVFDLDNPYEEMLMNLAVADSYRNSLLTPEKVDKLTKGYILKLKSNPQAAIKAIRKYLGATNPNQYPLEHASLIILGAQLDGQEEKVKAMAYDTFTTPIEGEYIYVNEARNEEELNQALSTTHEMHAPVVAHEIFLRKETNPDAAFSATVDAINSQADPRIKESVTKQLINHFPELESQIREVWSVADAQGTKTPGNT
ncbi:MAG: hypothetical protein ISR65_11100 [Bacteriovoracaceae bacterium]|nr:hypothetical protein [Bacteriovoracaceae bacterium]